MRARQKRRIRHQNILTVIVYVLLLTVASKILRIFPEPAELDINVVTSILSLVVSISTALATWVSRQFSSMTDKIESLEKAHPALVTDLKVVEQKVASLECNVDIRERMAKLEAITAKNRWLRSKPLK
jgi:hypothetical protein